MDKHRHGPSVDVMQEIPGFSQHQGLGPCAPIPSHVTRAHTRDRTQSLPTEILGGCLSSLSLRDLISASHVSSRWRATTVAFPALWTNIFLSPSASGHMENILCLALSRAGQLPVDLEFEPNQPAPRNLTMVVEENRLRFRSIRNFQISLDTQAPLLEEFDNVETSYRISSDFLGGVAGRLRTLRLGETRFPGTCPALSTVTHLRASYPWFDMEQPPHFERIFALCPRLEILDLRMFHRRIQLPAGRFPPTLKVVKLHSRGGCDLVRMYSGWAKGVRLPQVQLKMPATLTEYNLAPFLEGAVDVVITFELEGTARIVADLPDARRHTLTLNGMLRSFQIALPVANIFRDLTPAALGKVRTMRAPLSVLHRVTVVSDALVFPTVTRLEVDMFAHDGYDGKESAWGERLRNSCWKTLNCLQALPQRFPAATLLSLRLHRNDSEVAVQSLALHHGEDHEGDLEDQPTPEDARELLQYISAQGARAFPPVRVHGFLADVVRAVSAGDPTHTWLYFAVDDTLL